jgi:2-polyprenyl-3-methyl-5-hydroxy-6-metoxy-1,4-benzoquinol methylase
MFEKSSNAFDAVELQHESRNWWHKHPMNYDWYATNSAPENTKEFFEEIDRRFFLASPLYEGPIPFARIIPFENLTGKRVLEIGCGFGSHSQLLARAGCKLSSIDITAKAVQQTRCRLELNNLNADVREMDAEKMDFADNEFDFVWSWGVIHHSAHTDRIVDEVARVLKPGGEFRVMVYNRKAFDSYIKIIRGFVTGKILKRMSISDILSYYTDGYIARFYTRSDLQELLTRSGLRVRTVRPMGQTSELVPLPGKGAIGKMKYALVARLPQDLTVRALSRTGSFLFAVAYKPNSEI